MLNSVAGKVLREAGNARPADFGGFVTVNSVFLSSCPLRSVYSVDRHATAFHFLVWASAAAAAAASLPLNSIVLSTVADTSRSRAE